MVEVDYSIIEEKINKIFETNGIQIDSLGNKYEALDIDSLSFISVMVDIENEFQIEIPEDYFGKVPESYNDFIEMVTKTCSN